LPQRSARFRAAFLRPIAVVALRGLVNVTHEILRRTMILIALAAPAVVGCNHQMVAGNQPPAAAAVAPPQQPAFAQNPQQQALAQQSQQLQQRATALDKDNQELASLLAQSRQQIQLLEDQMRATQQQLRDTTDRLASVQSNNDQLRSQTSALTASMQTRGAAEIRANNSLLRNLTIASLPGVTVRQDGDVVRIELPGDQLFNFGTAQFKVGSDSLIRTLAADLGQNYPQQMIGIEGHTDGSPPATPQFPTDQHLAVAQATALFDMLTRSAGLPAKQLFVVGHGGSQPIVSNATEAGRARNRRLEVVVYPETVRR
jgi:flagellar motor protein MotB